MWFDTIWNTPLFWWLLLAVFGAGLIILILFWRGSTNTDPVKEHLDYFCRCYARGEISRDDFEELKKDLQDYRRKIKSIKNENQYLMRKHWKNNN